MIKGAWWCATTNNLRTIRLPLPKNFLTSCCQKCGWTLCSCDMHPSILVKVGAMLIPVVVTFLEWFIVFSKNFHFSNKFVKLLRTVLFKIFISENILRKCNFISWKILIIQSTVEDMIIVWKTLKILRIIYRKVFIFFMIFKFDNICSHWKTSKRICGSVSGQSRVELCRYGTYLGGLPPSNGTLPSAQPPIWAKIRTNFWVF
jgi:hypothetical protein